MHASEQVMVARCSSTTALRNGQAESSQSEQCERVETYTRGGKLNGGKRFGPGGGKAARREAVTASSIVSTSVRECRHGKHGKHGAGKDASRHKLHSAVSERYRSQLP